MKTQISSAEKRIYLKRKRYMTRIFATVYAIVIPVCCICHIQAGNGNTAEEKQLELSVSQATDVPNSELEIVALDATEDEPEYPLTNEEIELIALVTMAEAEGECEEGKRLVIDTILNRVDHKYWPDTVRGVIYQPHQFTSMWNGRVNRCVVKEDICQLVREELISRTNDKCVFFRTGRYSDYGKPMFKMGNHYFSSYE
jgi:N-acetylmuramoyl-L-alanine amidase